MQGATLTSALEVAIAGVAPTTCGVDGAARALPATSAIYIHLAGLPIREGGVAAACALSVGARASAVDHALVAVRTRYSGIVLVGAIVAAMLPFNAVSVGVTVAVGAGSRAVVVAVAITCEGASGVGGLSVGQGGAAIDGSGTVGSSARSLGGGLLPIRTRDDGFACQRHWADSDTQACK